MAVAANVQDFDMFQRSIVEMFQISNVIFRYRCHTMKVSAQIDAGRHPVVVATCAKIFGVVQMIRTEFRLQFRNVGSYMTEVFSPIVVPRPKFKLLLGMLVS